jgi:hypothetical protein
MEVCPARQRLSHRKGNRMDATSVSLIRRFAGQWVAWNRQQDRIVSYGKTFEEAKQAAAAAGESSVILTKASDKRSLRPHWLYAVAVFIALAPTTLPDSMIAALTTASSISQYSNREADDTGSERSERPR